MLIFVDLVRECVTSFWTGVDIVLLPLRRDVEEPGRLMIGVQDFFVGLDSSVVDSSTFQPLQTFNFVL